MGIHDNVFNIVTASNLNKLVTEPNLKPDIKLMKFTTLKQLKLFMKSKKQNILLIQPNTHYSRWNYTLIIIDQSLQFWKLEELPDGSYPKMKCTKCKVTEINDTRIMFPDSGLKCDECRKKERDERYEKQIIEFKKNLTKYYREQKCKYIEFKNTWKYFYNQYHMSKYDFNSLFVALIIGVESKSKLNKEKIRLNIELLSMKMGVCDTSSYGNCFEWPDKEHHIYKKDELFLLWTISGI